MENEEWDMEEGRRKADKWRNEIWKIEAGREES
jgi:hypothetical protein